jgi:hypothetical protein
VASSLPESSASSVGSFRRTSADKDATEMPSTVDGYSCL